MFNCIFTIFVIIKTNVMKNKWAMHSEKIGGIDGKMKKFIRNLYPYLHLSLSKIMIIFTIFVSI